MNRQDCKVMMMAMRVASVNVSWEALLYINGDGNNKYFLLIDASRFSGLEFHIDFYA